MKTTEATTISAGMGAGSARMRVLERSSWFAALPPALKREMMERAVVRRCAARSLIYAAGAAPSGLYAVLSGEVRLEHSARSGKFAFYQGLRAGDFFGLLSELDQSPRFSDARAWTETTVLQLPHAEFQSLYRTSAPAREAFVALICENLHTTLGILVEEHSAPPRSQIAHILLTLSNQEPDESREQLKLTHEAIAAMAGVSRQTTSKILHEFRQLGLIAMQYGQLSVLDTARLRAIAEAA
ncbi:Crp/Fnr family transcriptional regulator [Variovorax sp. dw_954]|uniref:Crp/Fnr family transcriptional regulator n=1 Tax=Variovorax sp. dw_954 TaxID=2720078 RepID=UPI001BD5CD1C|nr:Crp/Fnr family transcriptional regulator [Variovorax sp. dw_954]